MSASAEMDCNEILAMELKTGSVNDDDFYDFVQGSLIPEMIPFDGQSPKSTANCSIHYVIPVIQLFRDAGILVLFLPLHSPDNNPIELESKELSEGA